MTPLLALQTIDIVAMHHNCSGLIFVNLVLLARVSSRLSMKAWALSYGKAKQQGIRKAKNQPVIVVIFIPAGRRVLITPRTWGSSNKTILASRALIVCLWERIVGRVFEFWGYRNARQRSDRKTKKRPTWTQANESPWVRHDCNRFFSMSSSWTIVRLDFEYLSFGYLCLSVDFYYYCKPLLIYFNVIYVHCKNKKKTKKGPDSDSPRPIFGVGELEFSRHQVWALDGVDKWRFALRS